MSIETKHLNLSFGDTRVLNDINVSIEDGEFVGVMGRTGCGKTSFMQLLAGLIRPTGGEVLIDGENIFASRYDRKKLRRKLGFVFQFPEVQLFETTVERDVTFALKHSGLSRMKMRERAVESLAAVGFVGESILEQSPLSLSGGQRRRIAVAGVACAEAENSHSRRTFGRARPDGAARISLAFAETESGGWYDNPHDLAQCRRAGGKLLAHSGA